ncbi:phosphoribosylpyrophosphate synthetase [Sphingobacteriaceae bacterium]|nr:phosphoribosylpyrophosphate synthetase [Sphingobacteriaceae bacterium]
MENYDTLSKAITALKEQGYTVDFNLQKNGIICSKGIHKYSAKEFEIDKSFRFDVNEDPSDQSVLYAISSHDHKIKGLLVNGYGVYSDDLTNELLEKLK